MTWKKAPWTDAPQTQAEFDAYYPHPAGTIHPDVLRAQRVERERLRKLWVAGLESEKP